MVSIWSQFLVRLIFEPTCVNNKMKLIFCSETLLTKSLHRRETKSVYWFQYGLTNVNIFLNKFLFVEKICSYSGQK